jgi:hypothetical protein
MVAKSAKEPARGPLDGENIETEHWEDARHWMSIYDDLIRFKLGLLDRVKRELPKLHPVAQKAAHVDVTYIEHQMAGYLVSAGLGASGFVARSRGAGTQAQGKRDRAHPA